VVLGGFGACDGSIIFGGWSGLSIFFVPSQKRPATQERYCGGHVVNGCNVVVDGGDDNINIY